MNDEYPFEFSPNFIEESGQHVNYKDDKSNNGEGERDKKHRFNIHNRHYMVSPIIVK